MDIPTSPTQHFFAGAAEHIGQCSEFPLTSHSLELILPDFKPHFRYPSQMEISSAQAQVVAVKSGAGIGVLHDFVVRDDPDLVPLFPQTKAHRNYWVVWHETMDAVPHISATTRSLIDTVRRDRALFLTRS